jgi:hypothetical protein
MLARSSLEKPPVAELFAAAETIATASPEEKSVLI